MLANILLQTSGAEEAGVYLPELPLQVVGAATALPSLSPWQVALCWMRGDEGTWSSLLQPRLAMTAAMAFLSICLTLNLLGVSLAEGQAQDLRSRSLQRTMADTSGSLIRSFQGLRMVYRVESRVNELRTQAEQ